MNGYGSASAAHAAHTEHAVLQCIDSASRARVRAVSAVGVRVCMCFERVRVHAWIRGFGCWCAHLHLHLRACMRACAVTWATSAVHAAGTAVRTCSRPGQTRRYGGHARRRMRRHAAAGTSVGIGGDMCAHGHMATSNPKLKALELRASVSFGTGHYQSCRILGCVVGPGCNRTIGGLGFINAPSFFLFNKMDLSLLALHEGRHRWRHVYACPRITGGIDTVYAHA